MEAVANPILVVVPTETEQMKLTAALAALGATLKESRHGRLATWNVSPLNVVVAQGGLGKTQFAVQTQHLLNVGEWRFVICAGSAGSLSDELSTGDVVIATETIEHDIRKVARPTMPRFSADESLIGRCREAVQDLTNLRVQPKRAFAGAPTNLDDITWLRALAALVAADTHGADCESRRTRHCGHTAEAHCSSLRTSPQPSSPLIHGRLQQAPLLPD